MKKNTTKVIKEANKYLVMQCIQAFEPVTLEKIAEKTLLSRPTILEIINSFKEEGIVVNGGFRESTGGRSGRGQKSGGRDHRGAGRKR